MDQEADAILVDLARNPGTGSTSIARRVYRVERRSEVTLADKWTRTRLERWQKLGFVRSEVRGRKRVWFLNAERADVRIMEARDPTGVRPILELGRGVLVRLPRGAYLLVPEDV